MSSLTPEILLQAYAAGVFPMAEQRDDDQLFWVDPEFRGILPLDHFHLSRRLARVVKSERFTVRINSAFEQVIGLCREAAPDRPESWINDEIIALCVQLHYRGHAHSVECWRDDKLVGGLYGVTLGGAFFGESMFSRETDASKVALVHLVARLKVGDFSLLDTQFSTDHLSRFGVIDVPRHEYQKLLGDAITKNADFFRMSSPSDAQDVLQVIAQTS